MRERRRYVERYNYLLKITNDSCGRRIVVNLWHSRPRIRSLWLFIPMRVWFVTLKRVLDRDVKRQRFEYYSEGALSRRSRCRKPIRNDITISQFNVEDSWKIDRRKYTEDVPYWHIDPTAPSPKLKRPKNVQYRLNRTRICNLQSHMLYKRGSTYSRIMRLRWKI